MRYLLIVIIGLVLSGCALQEAHMRRNTVGRIPCAAQEITIHRGSTNGMGDVNWTATCRGRTFYCNQSASGHHMARSFSYTCIERD